MRTRGKFPILSTAAARAAAVAAVLKDTYAASSIAGVKSRRKFLRKALDQWEQTPFPPTIEKIVRVAAVLKYGKYRSASSYLGQYRADAEREGHEITGPMRRMLTDMSTSCERGQGPGIKAMGLPMNRLTELPKGREPWVKGGPISPQAALVVGAWFLTREVELSTSRACLVRVTDGDTTDGFVVVTCKQVRREGHWRGAGSPMRL